MLSNATTPPSQHYYIKLAHLSTYLSPAKERILHEFTRLDDDTLITHGYCVVVYFRSRDGYGAGLFALLIFVRAREAC